MADTENRALGDLFIITDIDAATIAVQFTTPAGAKGVAYRVLTETDGACVAQGKATVGPDGGETRFDVAMDGFTFWTLDAPFLYVLEMVIETGGAPIEVAQTFGMRKLHVEGNQILLNNVPLCVRGHIRGREAHDHPNLMGCSDSEYYAKNIRMTKAYGFNVVRFHSNVPPREWFEQADRLGILTHVELRKYYGKYQAERELMDHQPKLIDEASWVEMIHELRNHPSLMAYCLGNEIDSPGTDPEVKHLAEVTKRLDSTRLFIDTCARGQYDRGNVDFDVQHMSYYCPYGRHGDMFNTTSNWGIFGSVTGEAMKEEDRSGGRTTRTIQVGRPVIAHEVCHYIAYRNLDRLAESFARYGAEAPWWLDELKKLVKLKGHEADYPTMLAASRHYQHIWHKQALESARKSPLICGYHFLQFADTDRYENSNGLLDCFDDPYEASPKPFLAFNGDCVLLTDLPRRTFFEEEALSIPITLSHFSFEIEGKAALVWELVSEDGSSVRIGGTMPDFNLDRRGLRPLATAQLTLPAVEAAHALTLTCKLVREVDDAEPLVQNQWSLWVYPNRPEHLPAEPVTVRLAEVDLRRRYPQLAIDEAVSPGRLLICDRFDDAVVAHLDAGGDVMMLYRIAENRDFSAPREAYYMPSTQDRFKAVVWDRGHNLGGFMRASEALAEFPHGGYIDFQFANLIDDCDKLCVDDFPVAVQPIIQGNDKANRDRYDVFTFKLRELQPDWTMRRFAYLFDVAVGKGRLLMCGLNFAGLNTHVPEVCWLFESLYRYVRSDRFAPAVSMRAQQLDEYLGAKGAGKRIRERMMTQFWQLDTMPLETAQYWKDSEANIRREMGDG